MLGRRVVLVRHAHAEPLGAAPGGGAVDDAGRPLSARGRAEAPATAAWLHERGAGAVDLALVSPAVRTRRTWQLLSRAGSPVVAGRARVVDELYRASAQGVVALLAELPEEVRSVLVVGHEPVVSTAALALASPSPGSSGAALAALRAGVRPATAVVLDLLVPAWGDVAAGTARLTALGPP